MTINAYRTQTNITSRNVLLSAFAINTIGTVYHLVGGTPEVMFPVYAAELPPESSAILDVLWYQMAALLAGTAIVSFVIAFRDEWRKPVAWLIGTYYLVIAAICLFFSFAWFGHPWGLVQWVLFAIAGLLLIWAARTPAEADKTRTTLTE